MNRKNFKFQVLLQFCNFKINFIIILLKFPNFKINLVQFHNLKKNLGNFSQSLASKFENISNSVFNIKAMD